jgi:hypothetical protein
MIYLNFILGVIIVGIFSRLIEQLYKLFFLSLFLEKKEKNLNQYSAT